MVIVLNESPVYPFHVFRSTRSQFRVDGFRALEVQHRAQHTVAQTRLQVRHRSHHAHLPLRGGFDAVEVGDYLHCRLLCRVEVQRRQYVFDIGVEVMHHLHGFFFADEYSEEASCQSALACARQINLPARRTC
jgi:hypothetical protein